MKIRTLTNTDYGKFLPLIQDFRETEFAEDDFVKQLEQIQHFGEIWVVEAESGALIATGTILYEPKFIRNLSILAHIEDVCVKREYRRGGIGKMLIKHLMMVAKQKHCYKVTLDCADCNVPFYEACGLERRGNQMSELTENI
jgi:glucosamine-phosphate N-acetyltransferase